MLLRTLKTPGHRLPRALGTKLLRTTARPSSTAETYDEEQPFRVEPHSAAKMTDTNTRRIFNEDHDQFREVCR